MSLIDSNLIHFSLLIKLQHSSSSHLQFTFEFFIVLKSTYLIILTTIYVATEVKFSLAQITFTFEQTSLFLF